MRQRFRKGTTGSLLFTPREGPPTTSASVILTDPGADTLPTSTVALPSVATTLNTFEGYEEGVDFLSVLSTTGIVPGESYWIGTLGSDNLELIQVRDVVTNAVWLSVPTARAHVNGEDFRGAVLSAPLTATHTAENDQSYQAEWTYEVGGVTYQASTVWDVVLRVFRLTVTPSDLRRNISRALLSSLADSYTLDEAIDEAERMVLDSIMRDGRRPDLVRDPDQFRTLGIHGVRILALRKIADIEGVASGERSPLTIAQQDYDAEYGRIAAAGLTWYDTDHDAEVGGFEEQRQVGRYAILG